MRQHLMLLAAAALTACASTVHHDAPGAAASATPGAPVARGGAAAVPAAPRIRQVAAPVAEAAGPSAAAQAPARFTTEASWGLAGYNNNEVIYTILITNQDTRILRCSTELKGSYYEDGKKLSVSDRQNSTVFPGQQTQAGNWMGMDEQSGATYSVKCHAL